MSPTKFAHGSNKKSAHSPDKMHSSGKQSKLGYINSDNEDIEESEENADDDEEMEDENDEEVIFELLKFPPKSFYLK